MKNITDGAIKDENELSLSKEQIVGLAKNISTQYITFAEMLEMRMKQLLAINESATEYSISDIVTDKAINDIALAIDGLVVNMEDIKKSISLINKEYPIVAEKYEELLSLLKEDGEDSNSDTDIMSIEVHDLLQPYLKSTTDASNKIDVLTEIYTIEIQAPIETIMNNIIKANGRLEIIEKQMENKDGIK